MKSILIACISVFVLVFTKVDGFPVDNTQPGNFEPFKALENGFTKVTDFPKPENFTIIKNVVPQAILDISKLMAPQPQNSVFGSLFSVLSGIGNVYNEILSRQQALVNIFTCGNCVNEGWNSIIEVAMKVPELNWIYQPDNKEGGDFFTAFHQNGQVVGVGGSIVNNKPVPQYTFNKEGLIQQISDIKKAEIGRKIIQHATNLKQKTDKILGKEGIIHALSNIKPKI